MNKKMIGFILCITLLSGCSESDDKFIAAQEPVTQVEETMTQEDITHSEIGYTIQGDTLTYNNQNYTILEVDGGDRNGQRQANVAVDIGFGNRQYWGLTNVYGQLVYVLADVITLQDDQQEAVNSSGRYYNDEANVPGTEHSDLDQGHVIADSLGGVANAYNITPQDSTLNRHGDQAYMEEVIRDANGCTHFIASISYPNTTTQTPNKYKYEYILMGNKIIDEFENKNPEEHIPSTTVENISQIDTNGNGKITIAEAEAAGFTMPIYADHYLYKYMQDNDNDGMVGE